MKGVPSLEDRTHRRSAGARGQMGEMGEIIVANTEEFKRLLTAEQSKPRDAAVEDIGGAPYFCTLSSKLTPPVDIH